MPFVLTGTSDIAGISHRGDDADRGDTADEPDEPDDGTATTGEAVLHIPATCAPLPVRYGPTQASGASLVWLSHILGREPNEVARLSEQAHLEAVPRFLPYLDGERAPVWRPAARGVLQGLSLATGSAELARAVMRGVALSDRHVIETAIRGKGFPEVHLGGSAAATREWVRVRVEAFGTLVHLHREPETAALGACVLAASAGTGRPVAVVSARFTEADAIRRPAQTDTDISAKLYEAYRIDVHSALQRLERG